MVTTSQANPIQVRPIGSAVTLTCTVTVELSSAVDVPVNVTTMWTGPDGFMTTNTQPVMGSTTTYTSTAMVSPFGRDQSGNYSCRATVSSTSLNTFLTGSAGRTGTARVTVGETSYSGLLDLPMSHVHTVHTL